MVAEVVRKRIALPIAEADLYTLKELSAKRGDLSFTQTLRTARATGVMVRDFLSQGCRITIGTVDSHWELGIVPPLALPYPWVRVVISLPESEVEVLKEIDQQKPPTVREIVHQDIVLEATVDALVNAGVPIFIHYPDGTIRIMVKR